LKSHFEIGLNDDIAKPSLEMRNKLFNEVADLFPPKHSEKAFLRRALPYGSAFAATLAAVLVLVFANRHMATDAQKNNQIFMPISSEIRSSVDSARQGVENVNFL
jgi:hypothetical protein